MLNSITKKQAKENAELTGLLDDFITLTINNSRMLHFLIADSFTKAFL